MLDQEFRLRRIIRWLDGDRDVTSADVRAWREDYLARRRGDGERSPITDLNVSDDRPVADRFPAVSRLVAGRDGRVWVARYPKPRESWDWLVFEADGDFLCHAEPVPGLDTWEVGADYVLGAREDALGVESVVMLPLQLPAPGASEGN